MYVVPNRPTPDPERGGYLADAGREVEETPYWLRRVADRDVRVAGPPPVPAELPPLTAAEPAHEPADAGSSISTTPVVRAKRKGQQP